jgi:hypothetical protein
LHIVDLHLKVSTALFRPGDALSGQNQKQTNLYPPKKEGWSLKMKLRTCLKSHYVILREAKNLCLSKPLEMLHSAALRSA